MARFSNRRISNPKDRRRLEAIASKILAKAGYFDDQEVVTVEDEYIPVDPESIGFGKILRPTWVGTCRPYRGG